MIKQFKKWLIQKLCDHDRKVVTLIYYPDRYTQYKCPCCDADIFEGMDD